MDQYLSTITGLVGMFTGSDVYADMPKTPILPQEDFKYLYLTWYPQYTMSKLSYMLYGSVDKVYLILAANSLTNPYQTLTTFRVLKPQYVNEVRFKK